MADSVVAQNEENDIVYIAREQRLLEKWIDPSTWTGVDKVNYVRMQLYLVDWLTTFNWPSTSWIFGDRHQLYSHYHLQYDKELEGDDWPEAALQKGQADWEFGDHLFKIQFYLNPISIDVQRQKFKMWILDQFAALGGFLVFTFLFFGLPCAAIQTELYYAKIMQDSYRMKFNKII